MPAPIARSASPAAQGNGIEDLNDPDERVRAEAAMALGRRKERRAVTALSKVLHDDGSPMVREASARALGLIAAPASLKALQNAAQADDDRDVRRSASFAAEVIRANLGGR
jgi:HEAT repeat protein